MEKAGIKGVIFDFDGTLVNSEIDFKKIKEKILNEAVKENLKIPSEQLPILELIEKIKNFNKKKGRDFYIKAHKILKEEEIKSAVKTKPKKDVLKVLNNLRENKIKIGIITRNCKEVVINVIKKFSIPFDVVLTRDDVYKVKPEPYHIKKCLVKLGLKKNEVILVGDHFFDIKAAKRLNIKSIGVLSEYIKEEDFLKEGADFVLEEFEDLEYIIGIKGFSSGKLPNRFLKYLLSKYTIKDETVLIGPGVGIDCAILKIKDDTIFAKTDPITLTWQDIGFYLVNINLNDISVMGGIPEYFSTILLFPENITFPEIEHIFSQINEECRKYNIKWIGGHTEILSNIKAHIASGFLMGSKIRHFKRKEIKIGDIIFLVKEIGIEASSIIVREKYEFLKNYFSEKYLKKIKNSIKNPGISIYREAKILWENFDIKYMHDPTEGGISTALYEISEAKNIGILIEIKKLKFYPPTIKLCKIFNLDPYGIISSGCIVGILDKKDINDFVNFCQNRKIKFEIIGKVIEEKGVYYFKNHKKVEFPKFEKDEINKLF
ncbi:MAG: HAD-IA family hydrolase [Candidatus Omnitrophica bacterium]|nr:HAD-IA family hydrolase [Candidatus Omnitrophota bacterium]